jgi:hypothetical protein
LDVARSRGADYDVALTLDAIARERARRGQPAEPAADDERLALFTRLGVRSAVPAAVAAAS